jgi:phage recombination protein Bet
MEEAISVWDNKKEAIRKIYGSGLSAEEFEIFVGMGVSMGANPFNREIWAYKIGGKTNIFLSRDFARKKAQDQPDYGGHFVDAVYENDSFKVEDGVPKHSYNFKDRGKLIGAYALAWRKGIVKPFYVFCKIGEYNQKQALWVTKEETMIKKVTEHQVLRMAWQDVFKGTYGDAEQWEYVDTKPESAINAELVTPEQLAETIGGKVQTPDDKRQRKINFANRIMKSHYFQNDDTVQKYVADKDLIYTLDDKNLAWFNEYLYDKARLLKKSESLLVEHCFDKEKDPKLEARNDIILHWSNISWASDKARWKELVESRIKDLEDTVKQTKEIEKEK